MDSPNSTERTLRTITLISFIPALALLVPHAVVYHTVFPSLGLIPMFLSSVFGIFAMTKRFRQPRLAFAVDAGLVLFFLCMLVPFWIDQAGRWHDARRAMLGCYGTVPMMLNLSIHIFLTLGQMSSAFSGFHICPYCHIGVATRLRASSPRVVRFSDSQHSHGGKETPSAYQPVPASDEDEDAYDDARESSEIGTLFRPSVETLTGSSTASLKLV